MRPPGTRLPASILQAVFGVHDESRLHRFEELIERFAGRLSLVTALPPLRRSSGRRSPWARFLEARGALDAFVYEEIALRRAENARAGDGKSDDVLSLLLTAPQVKVRNITLAPGKGTMVRLDRPLR